MRQEQSLRKLALTPFSAVIINKELKEFLNKKVDEYDQPFFIEADPICIPHLFTKKQDIEIEGSISAIISWGNRTTILNKSKELIRLMDNAQQDFGINHTNTSFNKLLGFTN